MRWLRCLYNELATKIGIDLCLSVWKNSLPLSLETSATSVLVSTTLDTRHLFSQQLFVGTTCCQTCCVTLSSWFPVFFCCFFFKCLILNSPSRKTQFLCDCCGQKSLIMQYVFLKKCDGICGIFMQFYAAKFAGTCKNCGLIIKREKKVIPPTPCSHWATTLM